MCYLGNGSPAMSLFTELPLLDPTDICPAYYGMEMGMDQQWVFSR